MARRNGSGSWTGGFQPRKICRHCARASPRFIIWWARPRAACASTKKICCPCPGRRCVREWRLNCWKRKGALRAGPKRGSTEKGTGHAAATVEGPLESAQSHPSHEILQEERHGNEIGSRQT